MSRWIIVVGIVFLFIFLYVFIYISKLWSCIIGFNALLLVSSVIWYEVPGAKKLAVKGKKIESKEIETLLNKMGLENIEIYSIDSKNSNAFQIGGRGKYIFITNTLIEKLNEEELEGAIAHEAAHIKLRHVLKKILLFNCIIGTGVNALLFFSIFNLQGHLHPVIVSFGIWCIILLYVLLRRMMRQRFENQADCYAIKFVAREHLISALKKINSLIYPEEIIGENFMHNIVKKRIENIERCSRYGK